MSKLKPRIHSSDTFDPYPKAYCPGTAADIDTDITADNNWESQVIDLTVLSADKIVFNNASIAGELAVEHALEQIFPNVPDRNA